MISKTEKYQSRINQPKVLKDREDYLQITINVMGKIFSKILVMYKLQCNCCHFSEIESVSQTTN